ncbi:MAG: tetratricopeptide repeat protein [Deferrisomatales bacterium]|nr:tetratricopeptide repeat protein [Deferrisomatales bacterium]
MGNRTRSPSAPFPRLLPVLLALWLAGSAAAQQPLAPGTPAGTLSFARALLREGDSFRAATEYQRFLHHFPDDPAAATAREGLGRAFASAGRFDEAAAVFRQSLAESPGPDAPQARWLFGAALYQGGRYAEAASALLAGSPGGELEEAATVLGTLSLLRGEGDKPLPGAARADLAAAYRDLPRKSPGLAGTLSALLPGAGHLYCDRPRDGMVSLVLNGVFLWGTYAAVQQEQWALAGILGFFELGWYSGNIVSASNAAHKWNRREQGRFLREWEGGFLPQWNLALLDGGLGGALSWRW